MRINSSKTVNDGRGNLTGKIKGHHHGTTRIFNRGNLIGYTW